MGRGDFSPAALTGIRLRKSSTFDSAAVPAVKAALERLMRCRGSGYAEGGPEVFRFRKRGP
jgi:hypothetical protein